MDFDYYQVLGVPPDADLTAIKAAFRKRSMECHPDRGGTVERMRAVLEAWEILSNPETRRAYDESRANPSSSAQLVVRNNSQRARERAENFPRRWPEFEAFLDSIARDFQEAKYGQTKPAGFIPSFPTVENSVSGWFFLVVGGILGGWLLGVPFYNFMTTYSVNSSPGRRTPLVVWIGVMASVAGGAWLGTYLHQGIRNRLGGTRRTNGACRGDLVQVQPASSAVIACVKCGQKLRVPAGDQELVVICRACGHKFAFTPPVGGEDSPTP